MRKPMANTTLSCLFPPFLHVVWNTLTSHFENEIKLKMISRVNAFLIERKDDVLYMNVIANACMCLNLNMKDNLNRGSIQAKHFY